MYTGRLRILFLIIMDGSTNFQETIIRELQNHRQKPHWQWQQETSTVRQIQCAHNKTANSATKIIVARATHFKLIMHRYFKSRQKYVIIRVVSYTISMGLPYNYDISVSGAIWYFEYVFTVTKIVILNIALVWCH